MVKPPGIKGCYAWMECKMDKLYEELSYILIMGVVHLEIDDVFFREDGAWNVSKAEPLMMPVSDTHMHYGAVIPT